MIIATMVSRLSKEIEGSSIIGTALGFNILVSQILLLVNALVVCTALRTCLAAVEWALCTWLRTALSCLRHVL